MAKESENRAASPLFGWAISMLLAISLYGLSLLAFEEYATCSDPGLLWLFVVGELLLVVVASGFLFWAMRWHRHRWLVVLVPLGVVTVASAALLVWELSWFWRDHACAQ